MAAAAHRFGQGDAADRAAVLPFPAAPRPGRDDAGLAPTQRRRLELLRHLAQASRLTGARDPHQGCRLAAEGGPACPKMCSLAFFRLFQAAATRPPHFYGTSATALTSDEHWLLRLIERLEAGDALSAKALIAFRIAPVHRRRMLAAAIEFEIHLQTVELATA